MMSLFFVTLAASSKYDPEKCCESRAFLAPADISALHRGHDVYCKPEYVGKPRKGFPFGVCPIDLTEQSAIQKRFLTVLNRPPSSALHRSARQEIFRVFHSYTEFYTGSDQINAHQEESKKGDSSPHLILGISHDLPPLAVDLVGKKFHKIVDSMFKKLNAIGVKYSAQILIVTEEVSADPHELCMQVREKYPHLKFVYGEKVMLGSSSLRIPITRETYTPKFRSTGNRNYAMLDTATSEFSRNPNLVGAVFIHGAGHLDFYQIPLLTEKSTRFAMLDLTKDDGNDGNVLSKSRDDGLFRSLTPLPCPFSPPPVSSAARAKEMLRDLITSPVVPRPDRSFHERHHHPMESRAWRRRAR